MSKCSRVIFCLFVAWNVHTLSFFSFLFSFYFCSVNACVDCIVSGGSNQFFQYFYFCLFVCLFFWVFFSILVVVSGHESYLECWCVLFLLLFLPHTVCLRHLRNVRPHATSWVFLFFGPFVEVLLSSTLRMDPSILWGGTAQVFISLMRFLLCSSVSSSFLVFLRYCFFLIFSFIPHVW